MFIAKKFKKTDIVSYLLYMWHVEDLIRAYDCDAECLKTEYVPGFTQYTEEQRAELSEWYANLVDMMRSEGVMQIGHLQINNNIILLLTDLHNELLRSPKHPFYSSAYYKALPFIVEVRSKGSCKEHLELENCFEVLYGVLMLHVQKKPISPETETAVESIKKFLNMLAEFYKQEQEGTLEL